MTNQPTKVLMVEDNPEDALLVEEALIEMEEKRRGGSWRFRLLHAEQLSEALQLLARETVDLVLLDLSLSGNAGLHSFLRLQAHNPEAPIVLLSEPADESLALTALREGAADYLLKSELDCLPMARAFRHAFEKRHLSKKAREWSFLDELTGLYNRRGFCAFAEHDLCLARRLASAAGLLVAEVDHGPANPEEQQENGLLLMAVADLLRKTFHNAATLGRLGPSRFAVLAVERDGIHPEEMTTRLRGGFAKSGIQNGSPPLSLRVGAAAGPARALPAFRELLARAEASL